MVGVPGVGKTHTALELLELVPGLYVDLAGCVLIDEILRRVASALGSNEPDLDRAFAQAAPELIVLDHVDRLEGELTMLLDYLGGATPSSASLVISTLPRQDLSAHARVSLGGLSREECLALLREQGVDPDQDLSWTYASEIVAGHAGELVWISHHHHLFGLSSILEQLEFIGTPHVDNLYSMVGTWEITMERVWLALSDAERRVASACAVFHEPHQLARIVSILSPDVCPAHELIQVVQGLVDKGLFVVNAQMTALEGSWRRFILKLGASIDPEPIELARSALGAHLIANNPHLTGAVTFPDREWIKEIWSIAQHQPHPRGGVANPLRAWIAAFPNASSASDQSQRHQLARSIRTLHDIYIEFAASERDSGASSDSAASLHQAAMLAAMLGEFELALEALQDQASMLELSGDRAGASALRLRLWRWLEAHPRSVSARWYWRARLDAADIYVSLDLEKSTEYLHQFMLLDAMTAPAEVTLQASCIRADILAVHGKHEDALALYLDALKAAPELSRARDSACELALLSARDELAAELLGALDDLETPRQRLYRAGLALLQRDLTRAARVCSDALTHQVELGPRAQLVFQCMLLLARGLANEDVEFAAQALSAGATDAEQALVSSTLALIEGARPSASTTRSRPRDDITAWFCSFAETLHAQRESTNLPTLKETQYASTHNAVIIYRDYSTFLFPDGTLIDLEQRELFRRGLTYLCQRRIDALGPVTAKELFHEVWPDEPNTQPSSITNRARVLISRLRGLGLTPWIKTIAGGYQLEEALSVTVAER